MTLKLFFCLQNCCSPIQALRVHCTVHCTGVCVHLQVQAAAPSEPSPYKALPPVRGYESYPSEPVEPSRTVYDVE